MVVLLDQGYTETQQLVARIKSVDTLDGRMDDLHVHRAICTSCGVSVTTDVCQFCGFELYGPFASL